jgi:hypothetical protein
MNDKRTDNFKTVRWEGRCVSFAIRNSPLYCHLISKFIFIPEHYNIQTHIRCCTYLSSV